ncbi:hypothetical protein [Pseudoalteromonas prydzensis]|uniref:hypothetical protein n=1 Tax=Pseudoalteromonas prydzensis TaxID=182141 RepID=UPI0024BC0773|nr:hypothetical protein [Pseudoalteromonas prydzensis]|tara:strand:- start:2838 stop:3275 length:438 start_codon:yes stop_codon:yes gene_type:complete
MNLIKDISQLIDKLASFYLYKGIQPSEIADAIFEKQYSGVKLDRTENEIILIASFTEFDESNQTEYKHQVKYVYTNNRYLQVIEQKIGNKGFKVQWSRQEEIDKLLNEFSCLVQPVLPKVQLETIISTLPSELIPQVRIKLKLVA